MNHANKPIPESSQSIMQRRLKKLERDRLILVTAMQKIVKTPLNSDYYAEKALQEIAK